MSSYKVFGNLYLPPPSHVETSRLRILQSKLDILDHEERQVSDVFDVDHEFYTVFSPKESSFHQPPRPPLELVRPSGSLSAKLLLHLHYPSFRSNSIYNGELADNSNPSLRLLLSVFKKEDAFWVDTFSRREKRSKDHPIFIAERQYNLNVIEAHLQWNEILRQHAIAKVEVVFGKDNRLRMERQLKDRCQQIVLWTTPAVTLNVIFKESNKQVIERLVIFAHHPEYFYHNWTQTQTTLIDMQLTVAAKLAGLDVECTFFQRRAGYYNNPMLLLDESVANGSDEVDVADVIEGEIIEPLDAPSPTESFAVLDGPGLVEDPIVDAPQSGEPPTRGPRLVKPSALDLKKDGWRLLRTLQVFENDGSEFVYEALPQSILEWFSKTMEIRTHDDVVSKYMEFFWDSPNGETRNLDAIRRTWNNHLPRPAKGGVPIGGGRRTILKNDFDALPRDTEVTAGLIRMLNKLSAHQLGTRITDQYLDKDYKCEEFLIRAPSGTVVKVKCIGCGRQSVDRNVRWWKTDPKFYVAHLTNACPTPECTGHSRNLVPVDSSIPWRKGKIQALNVQKPADLSNTLPAIYFVESYGDLPQTIETKCRSCKDNQPTIVDIKPRWSGHTPPRYLTPHWKCGPCNKETYWIPTDQTPSMTISQARSHVKRGIMPAKKG